MKSNLDVKQLESCARLAKDIRVWLDDKDHPEHYTNIQDLELVRNFLYTLDLLETVLVRFEICTYFARQALTQLEQSSTVDSLAGEFWPIDIEEFYASNLLELCYQLSNASEELQNCAKQEKALSIFNGNPPELSDICLARHTTTHFSPTQFENLKIAQQYSILRRPYRVVDGKLDKELAKFTMPRVAELVKDSVEESHRYLTGFREATIG
jgi:hypothetical protein